MNTPNFGELRRPFADDEVLWRVDSILKWKSGPHVRLLAYIDARAAMERLDQACTPAGWSDAYSGGPAGGVMCTLSIKVGDEWVSKADVAENTNIEAIKGGVSDAFKRACVKWGMARNLYALGSTIVPVLDRQPQARSVKVYSRKDNVEGWAQAPHIETGTAAPLAPPRPTNGQPRPAEPEPRAEPSRLAETKAFESVAEAGVVPVCPSCKTAGVVNHDRRSDRSPDYLCGSGCKREGTDYDLGYWAASEKQQRMMHVVLAKYATARDVSKEVAVVEVAEAFGVPPSVAEWSQPLCSRLIDELDAANRDDRPLVEPAQPGPDDHARPDDDPRFSDDIPF